MAIETLPAGLWTPQAPREPQRELPFRTGTPDVTEATGVTMEMLEYLGAVDDANRETTKAAVQASFTSDAALGFDGRLFMRLPSDSVPFETLLAAAEGQKPEDVAEVWRWPNLWTPGTERKSFTQRELNGSQARAVTRLALFGSVPTNFDPVLHYLNLPYDEKAKKANPGAETVQLAEFAADQAAFTAAHAGHVLDTATQSDYLVWALMDRIRGVKKVSPTSDKFILNSGFMRIANLGRRAVDGVSLVGDVYSSGGLLEFDRSSGLASSVEGLGVVAGQQEQV